MLGKGGMPYQCCRRLLLLELELWSVEWNGVTESVNPMRSRCVLLVYCMIPFMVVADLLVAELPSVAATLPSVVGGWV